MAKAKEQKFAYYDEQFTRSAVIPETDRTPEVKYSYRPLSVQDKSKWDTGLMTAGDNAEALDTATLAAISKAIVSWDLRKPDRENPKNTSGLAVDPNDIEELKNVSDYIIIQIIHELQYVPVLTEAKAKN